MELRESDWRNLEQVPWCGARWWVPVPETQGIETRPPKRVDFVLVSPGFEYDAL
jgi:hypothetical protein